MGKVIARCFCGLGLDLNEVDIDNNRPDGCYLDEQLSTGIFTCISRNRALYLGIEPCFPWQQRYNEPKDETTAKRMIATHLLDYLKKERSRFEKEPEEYKSELEHELPGLDDIVNKIDYISDSWAELW